VFPDVHHGIPKEFAVENGVSGSIPIPCSNQNQIFVRERNAAVRAWAYVNRASWGGRTDCLRQDIPARVAFAGDRAELANAFNAEVIVGTVISTLACTA
jgi:hypothetical protein